MATLRRANYRLLLGLQLVLLLAYPLAVELRYGLAIVNGLLMIVLVSGVYAVSERRIMAVVLGVAGLLLAANHWLAFFTGLGWPAVVADILGGLFFCLVAWALLSRLLFEPEVQVDTIVGAISVYLLVGFAFAFLHSATVQMAPGSYAAVLPPGSLAQGQRGGEFFELLYFSLVTLSTLGFGDLVPVHPVARVLSVIEVMFGQIYLTVLVARLVGLHISLRSMHRP